MATLNIYDAKTTAVPVPTERPLKVFAFDPSAGRLLGNIMSISLNYEELEPGPVGKKLAVVDFDGSNKTYYEPVNLDDPKILIQGGIDPTESDPRFHQQMVYAVAAQTLQRFENALGRRIHWRLSEAEGRGESLTPELLPTPAYRDATAQSGHKYQYTVTAVDRSGNESGPSSPVAVEIP